MHDIVIWSVFADGEYFHLHTKKKIDISWQISEKMCLYSIYNLELIVMYYHLYNIDWLIDWLVDWLIDWLIKKVILVSCEFILFLYVLIILYYIIIHIYVNI